MEATRIWSWLGFLNSLDMEYALSMTTTLSGYLQSKGGIGLLTALQEQGKTYTEIEQAVLITSSTIGNRTDDAIELGLVEQAAIRREDRTLTEYRLTNYGEAVVRDLSQQGVLSSYEDMRAHQRELDNKRQKFVEWAKENPSQYLGFTEAHEETLPERGSDSANSSEHVVRPHPDDQEDETTDSTDSDGSELTEEEPEDDSQSRLSDTDIQEKMEATAQDTDSDEDGG